MILANRIGLLTPDELIAWADGMILGTSEPPSYLIDLALGDLPTDPEALDLVRNEPNESEIAQLAQLILERFNDTSEMNELGLHCYQLALLAKANPASGCFGRRTRFICTVKASSLFQTQSPCSWKPCRKLHAPPFEADKTNSSSFTPDCRDDR